MQSLLKCIEIERGEKRMHSLQRHAYDMGDEEIVTRGINSSVSYYMHYHSFARANARVVYIREFQCKVIHIRNCARPYVHTERTKSKLLENPL